MLLGVAGLIGAGKGELVDFLKSKGFSAVSLSDFLREECKKRGIELNRKNLTDVANELRRFNGPGFLAKLALERVKDKEFAVVDSIRNPEEINELKKRGDFILIAVDAPQNIRFERIKSRNRENDPKTLEEFQRMDFSEVNSPDPNVVRLQPCIEMADIVIKNDKTIKDFQEKIEELIGIPVKN